MTEDGNGYHLYNADYMVDAILHFLYVLTHLIFTTNLEVNGVLSPLLQSRKMRFKEVK